MSSGRDNDEANFICLHSSEGNKNQWVSSKCKSKPNFDVSRLKSRFTDEFRAIYERLECETDDSFLETRFLELLRFYNQYQGMIDFREMRRIMRRSVPVLMVERQIKSSDVVAEFLIIMYTMQDRYPVSLPLFLISSMNKIEPDGCNEDPACVGRYPLPYFEFFLRHAYAKRLMFGDKRLAQVILDNYPENKISTLLYSKPISMIRLLQYEGNFLCFEPPWNKTSEEVLAHGLEFIIFCGVTSSLWDTNLDMMASIETFPEYMSKMICNYRYLLRTIPNWHTATLRLAGQNLGMNTYPLPDAKRLRIFLSALFPSMHLVESRPASLKHSCRIVIRGILNRDWQLPDGIFRLGLPAVMEEYVNLVRE